ncbi:MAG: hypothetical protein KBA81_07020 [Rhabdochlamydiaceae bacterium]|nr:hypothetical protein [Rhabdochlamydiaceae bacterium]
MNRFITACVLALLCSGCRDSSPKDMDQYTTNYFISKNRFGVIVAEDKGVSHEAAQKYALERAAQVAHSHGYRYFTIISESQVAVLKTEEASPDRKMPSNIYYERIQKNHSQANQLAANGTKIPAYQIEISCKVKKPAGECYDACAMGACD